MTTELTILPTTAGTAALATMTSVNGVTSLFLPNDQHTVIHMLEASGVGTPTFTFTSVAAPVSGRTGDKSVQLTGTKPVMAKAGPFYGPEWNQGDGTVTVTISGATANTYMWAERLP